MIKKIEGYRGKVLPIVGRPGAGQESVALQIAIDHRERYGRSVLIINPVEDERSVRARIVCIRDRFSFSEALRGSIPNKAHQQRFDGAVRGLDGHGFIIDSTKEPSDSYILERALGVENLGLVVILDYDFIPKSSHKGFLCMLAEKLNVPVVVNALVNRGVDRRRNKIPTRADVKRKEIRSCDTVILVYREGYYKIEEEKQKDALLTVDRGGEVEQIALGYNPHIFKIYRRKTEAR